LSAGEAMTDKKDLDAFLKEKPIETTHKKTQTTSKKSKKQRQNQLKPVNKT
jgi:hypothetical protein